MIVLTIAGNPLPWKRPGINRKSGHIYDQQSLEKEKTRWQLLSQFSESILPVPVEVIISFQMPIPKKTSKTKKLQMLQGKIHHMVKPDIDNLAKYVLDCMKGIVYLDDAQIVKLIVEKVYVESPRTTVFIKPLGLNEDYKEGQKNDCI
jgi:Holliday junction resolvase RusA-like endonuclease